MVPRISVVIATHNRRAFLEKALGGLSVQTLPADDFEVIVVDNASTDGTASVVQRRAGSRPAVAYLSEPRPSSSAARNVGWRQARAPYVAFLDDDAVPSPDWLARILHVFESVVPHPVCTGGRVEPVYEAPVPDWVAGPLPGYLTVVNHPRAAFLTDVLHGQQLVSANMAVERTALEAVGGFSLDVGRFGEKLLSGEDALLQAQLEALGRAIYYDPAIHVRHHVGAHRLTPEWMIRRVNWGGVSDARVAWIANGRGLTRSLKLLAWGLRAVLMSPRVMIRLVTRDTRHILSRCEALHRIGFLVGCTQTVLLALRD